jgi:hypothetical protein
VEAVVDEGNQTIEVLESAEKTQRRKKDGMQYSCIVRVSAGSRFYSINDGVMTYNFRLTQSLTIYKFCQDLVFEYQSPSAMHLGFFALI